MSDYRDAYEEYQAVLEELAGEIYAETPSSGEGTLDGREWCEDHDVPERMFAHAIETSFDRFDYGVSPMHPWRADYDE